MSYGPDPREITERAAYVIDRVFRGAAPADLPLEEPTRFRLVVNLKAAAAIGLTISPPYSLKPIRSSSEDDETLCALLPSPRIVRGLWRLGLKSARLLHVGHRRQNGPVLAPPFGQADTLLPSAAGDISIPKLPACLPLGLHDLVSCARSCSIVTPALVLGRLPLCSGTGSILSALSSRPRLRNIALPGGPPNVREARTARGGWVGVGRPRGRSESIDTLGDVAARRRAGGGIQGHNGI